MSSPDGLLKETDQAAYSDFTRGWPWFAALLLLSLAVYSRSLSIPWISDDYVHRAFAYDYAPFESWPKLFSDALYRCRATSLIATWWLEKLTREPAAHRLFSIALHAVCAWLLTRLLRSAAAPPLAAALAGLFFAFHHGHQEAVIWMAAIPELWVCLFVMLGLWTWWRWLTAGSSIAYAATLVFAALALFSKESGVVLAPIAAWMALVSGQSGKRWVPGSIPLFAMAAVYFWFGYSARDAHQHYNDGTFSLAAPFLRTLAYSVWRLLWPWGLSSLIVLGVLRQWRVRPLLAISGWIAIAFLPYCFLLYMPMAPSRHTYMASAGLAALFGWAGHELIVRFGRHRRRLLIATLAAIVCIETGILWTRKQRQFEERAAHTERLVEFLRAKGPGPFHLRCFYFNEWTARAVVRTDFDPRYQWDPNAPPDRVLDFCEKEIR